MNLSTSASSRFARGKNQQEKIAYICENCGAEVATNNEIPKCVGCGKCVEACKENKVEAVDLGGVTVKQLLEEWSKGAEMKLVRCEICGRPFATSKEIERAGATNICPECKAKLSARAISMGRVRG